MSEYTKKNEGEGSQQGAREYNRGAAEMAEDPDEVKALAKDAARAVDEDEGELAAAEEAGKEPAAGHEPENPPAIYVMYEDRNWVIREAREGRVTHRFDHLEDAERRAVELGNEQGQTVIVQSPEGGEMGRHAPP